MQGSVLVFSDLGHGDDGTDLVGGGLADGDAGCGAAGERHAGDVGRCCESCAGGGAVAEHKIEDTVGKVALFVDE